MMDLLRSLLHGLWMLLTVVPWGIWMVVSSLWASGEAMYWKAARWLGWQIDALRILCGVQVRVSGMENLPEGKTSPAILLVKHQSTLETFLIPTLMPHPLAYVFKRELIYIPFFGWAIGSMDMIHIDRSQRAQAFNKVVEQGERLLAGGRVGDHVPGRHAHPARQGRHLQVGRYPARRGTGAPVIPIAVASAKVWPRKSFIKHAGIVDVSIGKAIPSTGRSADELMQEVQAWIEGEMRRLDPEAT